MAFPGALWPSAALALSCSALAALALSGDQPWRSALVLSGDHPPLALSGDQPLWSSAILLSHDPIGVHTSFGVSSAKCFPASGEFLVLIPLATGCSGTWSLLCLAALALWLLALSCLLRSRSLACPFGVRLFGTLLLRLSAAATLGCLALQRSLALALACVGAGSYRRSTAPPLCPSNAQALWRPLAPAICQSVGLTLRPRHSAFPALGRSGTGIFSALGCPGSRPFKCSVSSVLGESAATPLWCSALGPFAHRSNLRPLQSTVAPVLSHSALLQSSAALVLGHSAALAPRCLALGAVAMPLMLDRFTVLGRLRTLAPGPSCA